MPLYKHIGITILNAANLLLPVIRRGKKMNVRELIEQLESAVITARKAGLDVEFAIKELRSWFGLIAPSPMEPTMTESVERAQPAPESVPRICPTCGWKSSAGVSNVRLAQAMTRHRRALHDWNGSYNRHAVAISKCPV